MYYLYFLQNLRESLPSFITMIFVVISEAAIYLSIATAIFVYFSVNKKAGSKLFFNLFGAKAFSDTLKMIFCVNRPWIKDSRLHVAKEIESTATGYSFPSGHTTFATAFYGTVANLVRKKGTVIACLIMIGLTAFARNYVGAHTIYDVSCAILFTVGIMFLNAYLEKWMNEKEGRDLYILIVSTIITVVTLTFIVLRPYDVTVLEDGSLLVDPAIMSADAFEAFGLFIGWTIGWFVERRYINFSVDGTKSQKILRGIIAIAVFLLLSKVILKPLLSPLDLRATKFLRYSISMVVITTLYPLIIKKVQSGK